MDDVSEHMQYEIAANPRPIQTLLSLRTVDGGVPGPSDYTSWFDGAAGECHTAVVNLSRAFALCASWVLAFGCRWIVTGRMDRARSACPMT